MPGVSFVQIPSELLDAIADAIAQRVVDKLRSGEFGLVDQTASPLGSRRHCALARRLVNAGDPRAAKVGRRWLISREAISEALGSTSNEMSPDNELISKLGLE